MKSLKKHKLSVMSIAIISIGLAFNANAVDYSGPVYTAKKVNLPSSDYKPTALSENGRKLAGYKDRDGGGFEGWYYNGSSYKDFKVVGGWCSDTYRCSAIPTGINNNGDIVGSGYWGSNYYKKAWISRAGGLAKEIKHTTIVDWSYALDINRYGYIAAYGRSHPSYQNRGYRQHVNTYNSNSGAKDLGTLGGLTSYAKAINRSGIIVGESQNSDEQYVRAMKWKSGTMTQLPGLPGGTNELDNALGINDSGVIVGYAGDPNSYGKKAVKWVNNKIYDLKIKKSNGYDASEAEAHHVTNKGDIVGIVYEYRRNISFYRKHYPFVLRNGKQYKIADQIKTDAGKWSPVTVLDVSPDGKMLVSASKNGSSGYYVLTTTN